MTPPRKKFLSYYHEPLPQKSIDPTYLPTPPHTAFYPVPIPS
jgi:hypothetical protein